MRGVSLTKILGPNALTTAFLSQLRQRRIGDRSLQDETHASQLALAGELTASIAHEIQQPLAAILSNIETAQFLLQSEVSLRTNERLWDSLSCILADIRRDDLRASEVIHRLRSLLDKHEIELKLADLNTIVVDTCELLQGEAERRRVRIDIQQDSAAQVVGDRIQIQQVLINLIMNSMDAVEDVSEERRTIIVSVTSSERRSTINVRDRGHGIQASELPKIFEAFSSSKHTGMGLGLWIARTIVEAHGGCIEVTSSPGEGSEFRASFPSMKSTAQELSNADAS
jgi:C4-dicarboxylate-specific signal transduction histidine kinase